MQIVLSLTESIFFASNKVFSHIARGGYNAHISNILFENGIMVGNPLAAQQRETKGAETFGKYDYQYHWALCRLLDQHHEMPEYAIFVEHHEDVVLANSLDAGKAQFEFNQVKCKDGGPFTLINLTSTPGKGKNSVLGKLIISCAEKPFKASISTINLVATNGFHKDIVANDLGLEVITISDMSETALAGFLEKMKAEVGIEEMPANLRFIIPQLPSTGHQDFVVGKIVKLIEALFPDSPCQPANIYRLLIDELHRKGQVQYDYTQWDELLKRKALTSETVQSVVVKNTSIGGLDETKVAFDGIAAALELLPRTAARLKREVVRYYGTHIARPSALHLNLARVVKEAAAASPDLEYADLIKHLEDNMDKTIKASIGNAENLKAAIIYELIQVENEQ